jgi:hypothetical protein
MGYFIFGYANLPIPLFVYVYWCSRYHVDDLRYVASIFFYYYNDVNIF